MMDVLDVFSFSLPTIGLGAFLLLLLLFSRNSLAIVGVVGFFVWIAYWHF